MQQHEHEPHSAAGLAAEGLYTHIQHLTNLNEAETERTLGELVAPYLLALTEACWLSGALIGLAAIGFLGAFSALVPFWGVALALCAGVWLCERSRVTNSQRILVQMIGLLAALAGGLIWARLYSTVLLVDPRWLLALSVDVLSFNIQLF